jgi:hypothetical protein
VITHLAELALLAAGSALKINLEPAEAEDIPMAVGITLATRRTVTLADATDVAATGIRSATLTPHETVPDVPAAGLGW